TLDIGQSPRSARGWPSLRAARQAQFTQFLFWRHRSSTARSGSWQLVTSRRSRSRRKARCPMASVLIIEDEAPLSRMMAVFLLDAGFEVATAETVDKALAKVTTYQPDLIVFNTIMDDETKRRSIDQLRAASSNSKILDVSIEKNRLVRGIIDSNADSDGAQPSL